MQILHKSSFFFQKDHQRGLGQYGSKFQYVSVFILLGGNRVGLQAFVLSFFPGETSWFNRQQRIDRKSKDYVSVRVRTDPRKTNSIAFP